MGDSHNCRTHKRSLRPFLPWGYLETVKLIESSGESINCGSQSKCLYLPPICSQFSGSWRSGLPEPLNQCRLGGRESSSCFCYLQTWRPQLRKGLPAGFLPTPLDFLNDLITQWCFKAGCSQLESWKCSHGIPSEGNLLETNSHKVNHQDRMGVIQELGKEMKCENSTDTDEDVTSPLKPQLCQSRGSLLAWWPYC